MREYIVPKNNELAENSQRRVLSDLLRITFLQNTRVQDAQNSPFVIDEGAPIDVAQPNFVSKLNTIVYSNVIFNAGRVLDDNAAVIEQWEDFRIDDVLMSVTQAKKIVVTDIQGRDGTVKEYIGLDDYRVQITGRLTGAYGVNPREETKILQRILSAKTPLAITSWWLQNLDITNVVVTDYNFPQTEGEYSTQYFTVNAISDAIVYANITNQ